MSNLTDRDRKIALILVPVLLLAGYWFLILGPQRKEVSKLDQQLATAESARDESVATEQRLQRSRNGYAGDYETVVRLGKAIPSTLDMPSLLVQLESAAKGTGIDFDSITVGQRTNGATAAGSAGASGTPSGTPAGGSEPPVASGGEKATSGAGQSAEKANDAAATSNERNEAAGSQSADAPAGSSGAAAGSTTPTSPVAGLDTVPLNFSFEGSYFDLADFFHRVKRFVRVANSDIKVRGRLMTIDGMNLTTKGFPKITAEITATVYLSPKTEGATGGGTPSGPSATPASSTGTTPPASGSQPAAPTEPAGETPQ